MQSKKESLIQTRERFSHLPTFVGIQSVRNYSDSRFKILTSACFQFHLSLSEAVYISRKKKRFVQAKAVRIYPSTVSIKSEHAVTI